MSYRTRFPVRFGDVDSAGIVYYPRYLHYCHVAMEEFFREVVGVDYPRSLAELDFGLPAVHLETDFKAPLRYGDVAEVEAKVVELGRTSLTWEYTFYRLGQPEPLARARVVTVGLKMKSFEKAEIPAWLRERVAAEP
ncbi:MAG TPA: thioesterase family protein [Thermoanaerobaculia bacterium]|nr:thioesterase family protein [Thermoanaerobaculia bacterium]